jgi:hypothetical protein
MVFMSAHTQFVFAAVKRFSDFFLLFDQFFFFLKHGASRRMQSYHLLEILLQRLKVSKEPGRRVLTL